MVRWDGEDERLMGKKRKAAPEEDSDVLRVQTFLYILMRDHLPTGAVVEILEKHVKTLGAENPPIFTSKHLAAYAKELTCRLLDR